MKASTTTPQTKTRWQEIQTIWKDNRWLYLISGIMLGILSVPAIQQITGDLNALIGNLVPESIGIIFTVLFLNRAAENRAQEAIKQQLLAELNSPSTAPAVNALERLRREGWLDKDYFVGKNFHRANWEGAYIGDLSFEGTNLRHVNFKNVVVYDDKHPNSKVIFNGANLFQAHFEKATLFEAHFEKASLHGTQFKKASLFGANFQGADMRRVRLDLASSDWANFENANMERAILWGTSCNKANFRYANLSSASLNAAEFRETNFTGAILINAILRGVSLELADLTDVKWARPDGSEPAMLPDGSKWTPNEDMDRFTNPEHPDYLTTLEKINKIQEELLNDIPF